jgi:outer membrane protein OmpA-like peptidoglycan-associated protein/tetratricopeptide (TPR) repeat protein
MNKLLYPFLAFLCIVLPQLDGSAQSLKQKRADKQYNRFAYIKAANLYRQVIAKGKADDAVYMRTGDCYRLVGQWQQAEPFYAKVAQSPSSDANAVFYYAQALRANEKYDESLIWMKKFHDLQAADSRGIRFAASDSFIGRVKAQQAYFDIRPIDINTSQSDFGASFRKGQVVFASSRNQRPDVKRYHTWNGMPFLDLYEAQRSGDGNLKNPLLINKELNTKYHEGPACFTADGNTMYFTRNNYFNKLYGKDQKGVNNLKLFRASNTGGCWKEENLKINSDEYSVGHPALSADGKQLYFISDMPGGKGGTDIWRVVIEDNGAVGIPENLGEVINTEGNEMFPFCDADGNLFFASNGHVGLGGLDIFFAAANGNKYNQPINVGLPVNSAYDDFALSLDSTGKAGYISSNRVGGKGDDDIYAITLLRPFKPNYLVKGVARDSRTNQPLANTVIRIKDQSGKLVDSVITSGDGTYQFGVQPKSNYSFYGTTDKYFEATTAFNTNELGDRLELTQDIFFEKDPGLSLYVTIKDKTTGKPLDSVKVKVIDNVSGGEFTNDLTPASGDFRKPITDKKLGDRISYNLVLERPGYLAKTVTFNAPIEKEGELRLEENLDKIEVGLDLAKIIDIKPIYFDLGKYAIRPDAAKELDKIVKVMNENPNMVIELGSHTDCRSSATSNMSLSDRRAKASAEYIKKRITNPERIYGKGYGETQLVNGCACEGAVKSICSEEEHQKNRRTEFKIIKM